MREGDVIADRFELASIAGEGGMGLVWRATDRATGGDVALKVMLRAGGEEAVRFAREAKVLRELSHPGIVRHVADGVTPQGKPWLAMEWLAGEDLASRLSRGPLDGREALAVATGIAEALAHAHAQGLVHRDLKPGNVWLVEGDPSHVKLLDFGVVRRLDPGASMGRTRAGAMIGTPGYMAPEQARGERDVDARADVYALGCVLFECLTGRAAFSGEHVMALLAKVLLEEAPRLSSLAAVPQELDELVARMLAKDAAQRPDGAAEVLRALDAVGSFDVGTAATMLLSSPALSREQQWLCVLVVDVRSDSTDDATMASDTPEHHAFPIAKAAADSGARLEGLAGGAQILLWETSGAPAELAARAARAALLIQASMKLVPLALASGRAAVGGAVPVGEALERAAACVKRSAGQIVLDESVAKLLEAGFEVTRGDGTPTLVGERARDDGARTLLGKPTPCVGRDVELSTLTATLAEVADDRAAAAVVVTGEMGVGKSRVRHEWVRSVHAARPEARVWQTQSDVMRQGAAFGIAADLVRDACGVSMGASREDVRARIGDAVAEVVDEKDRHRVASRLCEMCGAPWETDIDEALVTARKDAIVMGDQLRAAWEDFLVAACAEQPVVLVVENLQWADGSSLALIDRALRNFGDKAWMVVGVGRPEHRERHPKLWAERGVRDLAVGPLKEKPAEKLVRAALGKDVADERVRKLVTRAAGNAYFLEELIRAEAEGRGDETPETVLAMVAARLLRLDAESRRVLRAASVYGARFDARGVAAVLGERTVTAALEQLAKREWLSAFPAGGYAFRQETSRDAAYAMLVEDDKRLAHGSAGDWLARSAEADPAAVAEHFERAGTPESAAAWWSRAAKAALEANDLRECVARAEAAERCGATGEVLCEALAARAEAHSWLGEVGSLREIAGRLRATAAGAPEWEAVALRQAASSALRAGDTERLAREVERMRTLLTSHPHLDEVVFCAIRVAVNALHAGLSGPSRARAALAESVEPKLDARGALIAAAREYSHAMRAHFEHDAEAYARGTREAAALYARAGDARRAANAEASAGYALTLLGAHDESRAALEASLAECWRLGLTSAGAVAQQNLGLALSHAGRHDEGFAAEQAAVEAFARGGDKAMECTSRVYASRILLAAGRVADAVDEAERAAALLAERNAWMMLARAALADALLARAHDGDLDAALAHTRAAREALRADPARFEEPAPILRVHLDALDANGLREEAARERAEARAWVTERAEKIQSEHYRRTFLYDEPDVSRIMGHR